MKKGAILIHGLTGTPATMAPLAGSLAKNGFMAETPLLAGHGTNVDELAKTPWRGWYKNVCDAYDRLEHAGCDEIYCAGLSLGALLTLKIALDGERPLKKIALMALPLKLSPVLERLIMPISHLPPVRQLIKYSKKIWEEAVSDEIGREIYKNASYSKIPVHSIWELQELQKIVLEKLPGLTTPTILIHSRLDKVALPFNVELFRKTAQKISPQVVWLARSEHVETLDCEKEFVADAVAGFFSGHP